MAVTRILGDVDREQILNGGTYNTALSLWCRRRAAGLGKRYSYLGKEIQSQLLFTAGSGLATHFHLNWVYATHVLQCNGNLLFDWLDYRWFCSLCPWEWYSVTEGEISTIDASKLLFGPEKGGRPKGSVDIPNLDLPADAFIPVDWGDSYVRR